MHNLLIPMKVWKDTYQSMVQIISLRKKVVFRQWIKYQRKKPVKKHKKLYRWQYWRKVNNNNQKVQSSCHQYRSTKNQSIDLTTKLSSYKKYLKWVARVTYWWKRRERKETSVNKLYQCNHYSATMKW